MATLVMPSYEETTVTCSSEQHNVVEDDPMSDDTGSCGDVERPSITDASDSNNCDLDDFVIVELQPTNRHAIDINNEENDHIDCADEQLLNSSALPLRPAADLPLYTCSDQKQQQQQQPALNDSHCRGEQKYSTAEILLPITETTATTINIDTALDEAFDEADDNSIGSNTIDRNDDDDLFRSAIQQSLDDNTNNNDGDFDRIMTNGRDNMTAMHNPLDGARRHCVSPVTHNDMIDNDHCDDLTEIYSTPMSSPIRTMRNSYSTAIISWPIQQISWNSAGTITSNSAISMSDVPYHGLSNLGNTCYMASALQMLCSVSCFTDALRSEEPSIHAANTQLRIAFLILMEQLQQRKTNLPDTSGQHAIVSPRALKDAIDDRTSLFAGYRQQDAHEFVTTVLDVLDEDYKKTTNEEVDEETTVNEEVAAMDVVVDSHDNDDVSNNTSGEIVMERSNDTEDDCDSTGNRSKKQKMARSIDTTADDEMSSSLQSLQQLDDLSFRSSKQSYSELDVDAIERLIHGGCGSDMLLLSNTSTVTLYPETHNQQQQRSQSSCKLIGGRMNTNDVILTPYKDDADIIDRGRNESSSSSLRRPSLFHESLLQQHATTASIDNGSNSDTMMEVSCDGETDEGNNQTVSPIDTTFTTEARVRLTCDSCKFTRTHKETFLHLSLEIGSTPLDELCSSTDSSSIEDGIRRFFAPCTQELKCDKCFCETATQCMEITKLPPVLLLHLKRFIVDYSADWSRITYQKNQSPVQLNEELSLRDDDDNALSEFLAPDCSFMRQQHPSLSSLPLLSSHCQIAATSKYVLRSIVNHIGSSANCGHYTADAQRGDADDDEQREWFRFNDTYVSSLSASEVLEQSKQTAYMCLYELVSDDIFDINRRFSHIRQAMGRGRHRFVLIHHSRFFWNGYSLLFVSMQVLHVKPFHLRPFSLPKTVNVASVSLQWRRMSDDSNLSEVTSSATLVVPNRSFFPIYYNDVYEVQLPPNHRFPMEKYRKVREAIQRTILSSLSTIDPKRRIMCEFRVSPLATISELSTTHSESYIQRVLTGNLSESEIRNVGFPWSPSGVDRAFSSVGGTIAAAVAVCEELKLRSSLPMDQVAVDGTGKEQINSYCWSAHVAGGTHHAFFDYGEGFCVFSDIAVAANVLLHRYPDLVKRVLIIDLDVHQGNGNADLFDGRNDVFTFSMHCSGNYFSEKRTSDLDVELPIDCNDETYLATLRHWLRQIEKSAVQFDFIFYQAGVDVLSQDRLGRMNLTPDGVKRRDALIYNFAANVLQVPMVITMGGGYPRNGSDWSHIIDAHANVYIEAYNFLSV